MVLGVSAPGPSARNGVTAAIMAELTSVLIRRVH